MPTPRLAESSDEGSLAGFEEEDVEASDLRAERIDAGNEGGDFALGKCERERDPGAAALMKMLEGRVEKIGGKLGDASEADILEDLERLRYARAGEARSDN